MTKHAYFEPLFGCLRFKAERTSENLSARDARALLVAQAFVVRGRMRNGARAREHDRRRRARQLSYNVDRALHRARTLRSPEFERAVFAYERIRVYFHRARLSP